MHNDLQFIDYLKSALSVSLYMGWEMFWALVLGFALSALVQAVVSKSQMGKLLPDNSWKSISLASLAGAASSSCSYAAAAIARALIKQGADFSAAMAFQFASTNLVIELSILLTILLGWQFTLAQFIGGITMIFLMSLIFRFCLPKSLIAEAKMQAEIDLSGKMEGHARMDMSVADDGFWQKVFSDKGRTAISHYFFMDWASLWLDILVGILIAGILCAYVPESFWAGLFFKDDYQNAQLVGPLVGPLVAVLSFVCSIGNVPMAAVLWQQGMSFGGVLCFLFADLLVLPLLDIYRKYYGTKMAAFLAVSFYVSIVAAAYFCQWLFLNLGIHPVRTSEIVVTHGAVFYYTTVLNIIAAIFMVLAFRRFYKTGGPAMLKAMDRPDTKDAQPSCH